MNKDTFERYIGAKIADEENKIIYVIYKNRKKFKGKLTYSDLHEGCTTESQLGPNIEAIFLNEQDALDYLYEYCKHSRIFYKKDLTFDLTEVEEYYMLREEFKKVGDEWEYIYGDNIKYSLMSAEI